MKKWLKYILITSIFMFAGMNSSLAETAKLKCEYTLNYNKLGLGYIAGKSNLTMSVFDKKATSSIKGGTLVGDEGAQVPLVLMSGFESEYFKTATKGGNYTCPDIKVAAYDNGVQLSMVYQDTTDALNTVNFTSKSVSGTEKVTTKEEVCSFNTKEIKTQSTYLTIRFYKTGSNKTWEVIKNFDSGDMKSLGEVDYNQQISDGQYGYKISENDYETYWNAETCEKGQYVQYPGGYVFTIQSEKPSDVENGEAGSTVTPTKKPDSPQVVNFGGCADMPKTTELLRQVYRLVRYLIPVLIIVLSIVDFIKVVANGDDKEYKNAWNKFIKRIIIGIVIIIVPTIISMLIGLSGLDTAYGIKDIICVIK